MATNNFSAFLAAAYMITPELGQALDQRYGRDEADEDAPECPLLREASELSAVLIGMGDYLSDQAPRSIDGNPWNGVDHENLRFWAFCLLRQVDRYDAVRRAHFGVHEHQPIPSDVIETERHKCDELEDGE